MAISNDQAIKRMAEFLRKGNKMLDLTCPACNNPLFKLKNSPDIYCPCCEKQVIMEKQEETSEENYESDFSITENIIPDLKLILSQKLMDLTKKLVPETDLSTIKKILKILRLGLTIIKSI